MKAHRVALFALSTLFIFTKYFLFHRCSPWRRFSSRFSRTRCQRSAVWSTLSLPLYCYRCSPCRFGLASFAPDNPYDLPRLSAHVSRSLQRTRKGPHCAACATDSVILCSVHSVRALGLQIGGSLASFVPDKLYALPRLSAHVSSVFMHLKS